MSARINVVFGIIFACIPALVLHVFESSFRSFGERSITANGGKYLVL